MAEVFDNDLHDYLTRLDDDETDGERLEYDPDWERD